MALAHFLVFVFTSIGMLYQIPAAPFVTQMIIFAVSSIVASSTQPVFNLVFFYFRIESVESYNFGEKRSEQLGLFNRWRSLRGIRSSIAYQNPMEEEKLQKRLGQSAWGEFRKPPPQCSDTTEEILQNIPCTAALTFVEPFVSTDGNHEETPVAQFSFSDSDDLYKNDFPEIFLHESFFHPSSEPPPASAKEVWAQRSENSEVGPTGSVGNSSPPADPWRSENVDDSDMVAVNVVEALNGMGTLLHDTYLNEDIDVCDCAEGVPTTKSTDLPHPTLALEDAFEKFFGASSGSVETAENPEEAEQNLFTPVDFRLPAHKVFRRPLDPHSSAYIGKLIDLHDVLNAALAMKNKENVAQTSAEGKSDSATRSSDLSEKFQRIASRRMSRRSSSAIQESDGDADVSSLRTWHLYGGISLVFFVVLLYSTMNYYIQNGNEKILCERDVPIAPLYALAIDFCAQCLLVVFTWLYRFMASNEFNDVWSELHPYEGQKRVTVNDDSVDEVENKADSGEDDTRSEVLSA